MPENTHRLNELTVNAGIFTTLNSLLCNSNKTSAFLYQILRTKKSSLKNREMCDGMTCKSFYTRNITPGEPKVVNKL